jgi:uncharacterized delta-60 repeat protein
VSALAAPGARGFGKRIAVAASGLLIAQLALAVPAEARGGTLDRTFSKDGLVRSVPGLGPITDLVLDARHRIVLADDAFGLARLKVNGALDTTFGNRGVVSAPFHGWAEQVASDLARGADGSLVVAGVVKSRNETKDRFAIARFTASGRIDSSFGNHGRVVLSCQPRPFCGPPSLAAQPDGKIVVASWTGGLFVFRLDADGSATGPSASTASSTSARGSVAPPRPHRSGWGRRGTS